MGVNMIMREPTKKDIVAHMLSRKPWVVPILYHIYSLGGAKISELKEVLKLRTPVLKRGLWWLIKYGFITRSGEKFIVTNDYKPVFDEIFLFMCKTRNYYILKYGATYVVVIVRRTRVSTYTVPAKLIDKLAELEEHAMTEFTAKNLADALDIPTKLAYRAVKIRKMLKECRM